MLSYDEWKNNKRIVKIEKFSGRLLIHTADNNTYCYGSKCKCKEIGIKVSGKTNKWPWGEEIKGDNVSKVTRTYLAACPGILNIDLSEAIYDKKIRNNEKNKLNSLYNENTSISHVPLFKMGDVHRQATNIAESDLIAISEIMELVNLKKENTDSGTSISDSEEVLRLARKFGWNKLKWLKSSGGLQPGRRKESALAEPKNHILMLGKMHPESKTGVIIISVRNTERKLGWINNLLRAPIKTSFYGFYKPISVNASFHSSMKSSWSKETSKINEIRGDGGIAETLNLWTRELYSEGAKDIQIIVTGHSQGGAMANLIAAKLVGEGHIKRFANLFNVSDKDRLWLITYGAPAVI